ncbi:MAG: hypothetical protein K2H30_06055 [Clostridia bacterium]|nr:hypothetical protein [Clostridia bacterium]
MKVKDIIVTTLKILGRNSLAEKLAAGGELDGGEKDTVNTLVHCFNAVEDEVARSYIPLCAEQTVISYSGEFYYTLLEHTPVRINSVLSDGEAVSFKLYPEFIKADATKAVVQYDYAPAVKDIDGVSEFNCAVGVYLFACGAAAEFCLINGEIQAAEIWESKYRQEIEGVQRKSVTTGGYIPPRRWV